MGLLNPIKSMPHIYKPPAFRRFRNFIQSLPSSLLTKMTDSNPLKGKFSKGVGVEPDVFRFDKPTIMRNIAQGQLPVDAASHLPASEIELGLIRVGAGLAISEEGVLSASSPEGGIASIQEGAGISVDATDPNNPIVSANVASETTLGAIKVGANLTVTADGVLSAEGGGGGIATIKPGPGIGVDATDQNNPVVSADVASETTLGAIKVGANLTVTADGTLDAEGGGGVVDKIEAGPGVVVTSTIPSAPEIGITPATAEAIGGIKVGAGLAISENGVLSAEGGITPATKTTLGGIKVGGGLAITTDGTLSNMGSPVQVRILKGNDSSYTVKEYDIDLTIITQQTPGNINIFLDSTIDYVIGAKVKLMCASNSPTQVVPLGITILDTGGPFQRGRSILVPTSEATKDAQAFGELVYAGDQTWVYRAPQLQVGAPWVEYAGQVDQKWSAGQFQVKCNTAGEDLSKVVSWNVVGTPQNKANPAILKSFDKKARTATLGPADGVVESAQYYVKTQYQYFETTGSPVRLIDSVNPNIIVVVDKSTPSKPENLKVIGWRGARCFIDFDYDTVRKAPWTGYEARAYDSAGKLVTDWVKQDITPDKDPNKPWKFIQFWPSYQQVVGNGCKVDFRLTNNMDSGKGDIVTITVDWDKNLLTPALHPITVDRTFASINWDLLDGTYDDRNCTWKLVILQDGIERSSGSYQWNDNSGGYTGNANQNYTAVVSALTYGRSGPETRQDFKIPSPF